MKDFNCANEINAVFDKIYLALLIVPFE